MSKYKHKYKKGQFVKINDSSGLIGEIYFVDPNCAKVERAYLIGFTEKHFPFQSSDYWCEVFPFLQREYLNSSLVYGWFKESDFEEVLNLDFTSLQEVVNIINKELND